MNSIFEVLQMEKRNGYKNNFVILKKKNFVLKQN